MYWHSQDHCITRHAHPHPLTACQNLKNYFTYAELSLWNEHFLALLIVRHSMTIKFNFIFVMELIIIDKWGTFMIDFNINKIYPHFYAKETNPFFQFLFFWRLIPLVYWQNKQYIFFIMDHFFDKLLAWNL